MQVSLRFLLVFIPGFVFDLLKPMFYHLQEGRMGNSIAMCLVCIHVAGYLIQALPYYFQQVA